MPELEYTLSPYLEARPQRSRLRRSRQGLSRGTRGGCRRDPAGRFFHPLLNDSKKLTEKTRDLLREVIVKEAIRSGP